MEAISEQTVPEFFQGVVDHFRLVSVNAAPHFFNDELVSAIDALGKNTKIYDLLPNQFSNYDSNA